VIVLVKNLRMVLQLTDLYEIYDGLVSQTVDAG